MCVDNIGSYTCTCNNGYFGNGYECKLIDYCLNAPCDLNASCHSFIGGFNCTCNSGYIRKGKNCIKE